MVEMDINLHHKPGGSEPKPTRRMRRWRSELRTSSRQIMARRDLVQELLGVFVRAGSLEIVVCDCGGKSEEELEGGRRLK